MAKITFDGCGILSGEIDFDEVGRKLAERRKREQEVTEYERGLQAECDVIDAYLLPYLKDELAAEAATTRPSPQARKDFEDFRDYCGRNGFPALPSRAQPVAEFLGSLESNAARFKNSISTIHRAVGFDDPTDDVLVRALMRKLRAQKESKPQQKEEN
jgi:nucleoid-associated protein YejK